MNIIDAHVHLNPKNTRSFNDLIYQMDERNVNKGVLIINTREELDMFLENKKTFLEYKERFRLVCGVNIHETLPFQMFDELKLWDDSLDIKLHPLLYNYKKEDFYKIENVLVERLNDFRNIVIDTLYNDEHFENHIGIELGAYLARKFPQKKVVLAHSGSVKLLECFAFTRQIPNIFYDFSFVATYFDHTHIRFDMINYLKYTSNRIMFGSDYPSFKIENAIAHICDLFKEANMSDEQINDVLYSTAERIYFGGIND